MTNKYSKVLAKVSQSVLDSGYFEGRTIVVDFKSVSYFPDTDMLTQTELNTLSSIADKFRLHWYVSVLDGRIYFRMYVPKLVCGL